MKNNAVKIATTITIVLAAILIAATALCCLLLTTTSANVYEDVDVKLTTVSDETTLTYTSAANYDSFSFLNGDTIEVFETVYTKYTKTIRYINTTARCYDDFECIFYYIPASEFASASFDSTEFRDDVLANGAYWAEISFSLGAYYINYDYEDLIFAYGNNLSPLYYNDIQICLDYPHTDDGVTFILPAGWVNSNKSTVWSFIDTNDDLGRVTFNIHNNIDDTVFTTDATALARGFDTTINQTYYSVTMDESYRESVTFNNYNYEWCYTDATYSTSYFYGNYQQGGEYDLYAKFNFDYTTDFDINVYAADETTILFTSTAQSMLSNIVIDFYGSQEEAEAAYNNKFYQIYKNFTDTITISDIKYDVVGYSLSNGNSITYSQGSYVPGGDTYYHNGYNRVYIDKADIVGLQNGSIKLICNYQAQINVVNISYVNKDTEVETATQSFIISDLKSADGNYVFMYYRDLSIDFTSGYESVVIDGPVVDNASVPGMLAMLEYYSLIQDNYIVVVYEYDKVNVIYKVTEMPSEDYTDIQYSAANFAKAFDYSNCYTATVADWSLVASIPLWAISLGTATCYSVYNYDFVGWSTQSSTTTDWQNYNASDWADKLVTVDTKLSDIIGEDGNVTVYALFKKTTTDWSVKWTWDYIKLIKNTPEGLEIDKTVKAAMLEAYEGGLSNNVSVVYVINHDLTFSKNTIYISYKQTYEIGESLALPTRAVAAEMLEQDEAGWTSKYTILGWTEEYCDCNSWEQIQRKSDLDSYTLVRDGDEVKGQTVLYAVCCLSTVASSTTSGVVWNEEQGFLIDDQIKEAAVKVGDWFVNTYNTVKDYLIDKWEIFKWVLVAAAAVIALIAIAKIIHAITT